MTRSGAVLGLENSVKLRHLHKEAVKISTSAAATRVFNEFKEYHEGGFTVLQLRKIGKPPAKLLVDVCLGFSYSVGDR